MINIAYITVIQWHYNQRDNLWVITVIRNGNLLAWVFRRTPEECRAWADKNIPIYAQGKLPNYG